MPHQSFQFPTSSIPAKLEAIRGKTRWRVSPTEPGPFGRDCISHIPSSDTGAHSKDNPLPAYQGRKGVAQLVMLYLP